MEKKIVLIRERSVSLIHDLKNMLTTTLCYADLALCELEKTHPAYRKVRKLSATAKMAAYITKNLLSFKHGDEKSVKVTTEIRTLVEKLGVVLKEIAPDKIVISIKTPESPVWLDADAERIQQALFNLCINSIDAMAEGGQLTISLSVRSSSRARTVPVECVCLTVSDTGAGISQADLVNLFVEGFTTKLDGTGYGLSIVEQIVNEHNGWIDVESEVNEGTCFKLYFPIKIT